MKADRKQLSESEIAAILPFPYDSLEEVNRPTGFTMKIGRATYIVSTFFDPDGRESVFRQIQKVILADP